MNRTEELKEQFHLIKHPEGGWFAEVFETCFQKDSRPLAGSIYFLLDGRELSHFHVIDCDEVWYYHEGCGMRIICIDPDGTIHTEKLGMKKDEHPMVVIKAGTYFAAENSDKNRYTFVSCMTTPQFTYDGFHLCSGEEMSRLFPQHPAVIEKYCIR